MKKALTAIALALSSLTAQAVQVFDFTFGGVTLHGTPFEGTVHVETVDGGAGLYSGADLLALDVDAGHFFNSATYGWKGTPTVRLNPGEVVGIDAMSWWFSGRYGFTLNGSHMMATWSDTSSYGRNDVHLRAPLVPVRASNAPPPAFTAPVSAIPEPETYALMLAGLGFIAYRRRWLGGRSA